MTTREVADIVKRFVVSTLSYGTRNAGRLGGVSHTTVAEWRTWRRGGSNPETLPPPLPETVLSLRGYLEIAGDVEIKRAAFRIAADRLDGLAKQLRSEAASPSTDLSEPDAVAGLDSDIDLDEGPEGDDDSE